MYVTKYIYTHLPCIKVQKLEYLKLKGGFDHKTITKILLELSQFETVTKVSGYGGEK